MAGRRGLRWLLRHDPGLAASRRAARVAVVATVAFMLTRYGLGSPTIAVYAVFGAIGFGVLSQVVGTPRERTRTLVACFVAGTVLVTIGTLLAGSTAAATIGMLVVGVVVAFLPTGGPRAAGVASGLQLLYILPSFPPYAPETLPGRLIGLAIGMGLLAIADRVLWPPRPIESYACRAAAAARTIADLVDAATTGVGDLPTRRAVAEHADGRLKLLATPWEERPTGPGAEDRGLAHLGAALRAVRGRVEVLVAGDTESAGDAPAECVNPDVRAPLAATAASLRRTADALVGHGPPPEVADVDAARASYTARRLAALATVGAGEEAIARARAAVAVGQILSSARVAVQAARIVVDPRGRTRTPAPGDLAWWTTALHPAAVVAANPRPPLTAVGVPAERGAPRSRARAGPVRGGRARPLARAVGPAGDADADADVGDDDARDPAPRDRRDDGGRGARGRPARARRAGRPWSTRCSSPSCASPPSARARCSG